MVEKLRQLKEKSHMTNQQIAGKSNIPESTVARIFSGKTPNPTVTTVIAMARAMGSSAADLLSETDGNSAQADSGSLSEPQSGGTAASIGSREMPDASDDEPSVAERGKNAFAADSPHLFEDGAVHNKIYEDMLRLYKEEFRKKDIWIARLFWCLVAVVLFILFILMFDILHPGSGFVKY